MQFAGELAFPPVFWLSKLCVALGAAHIVWARGARIRACFASPRCVVPVHGPEIVWTEGVGERIGNAYLVVVALVLGLLAAGVLLLLLALCHLWCLGG